MNLVTKGYSGGVKQPDNDIAYYTDKKKNVVFNRNAIVHLAFLLFLFCKSATTIYSRKLFTRD